MNRRVRNRTHGGVGGGTPQGSLPPDRALRASRRYRTFDGGARRPPLSCRTSPPQGGRLAATTAFANRHRCKSERCAKTADLPPSGGDVRQDRGGREGSLQICIYPGPLHSWADVRDKSRGLRPRRFAPCSAPGRRSDRRFRQSPRYTTHAHVTCAGRRRGADQRHQCHREGGEDAGVVTYSDHGYSLGTVLVTAHLRLPFTHMPTRAVVSAMPFFDPDGARLKA
ncbi:hypothetical protein SAMN05428953_1132 [Mesorhizobium muleiense]|uniref:Glycine cleavage T-protein C-terminal barrel domain-containing protein n=1 Tax=Mesorhizobium muleiense TaxID=1004279 RepID=A0A1G9AAM7_9HYPH|nr:hypothetical protein SAMN05428953_1132 [Mesorhizobium muleiense]